MSDMKIGIRQTLRIDRIKEFGAFLVDIDSQGSDIPSVLLPIKQLPEDSDIGDMIEVFIYKDSSDRLIATTRKTILTVGEVGEVVISDMTKIGAFVDIGLEKEVLLPFIEIVGDISKGDKILAALYVDKTDRLAATMKIYKYLSSDSPYHRDDEVIGIAYEFNDIGLFIAVDNKYYGMVPSREIYDDITIGSKINARVTKVRADGKLDLNLYKKSYQKIDDESDLIWQYLIDHDGKMPYNDKSDPEDIKRIFHMSKASFKRAIGHLLKEGKIDISDDKIVTNRQRNQ